MLHAGYFYSPPWTDQGVVATKFLHWFNYVANKRWSDNKNRSLKGIWVSLGEAAADYPPDRRDPAVWVQLIEQYKATAAAEEGSTVK